jgi:hypothetical protein
MILIGAGSELISLGDMGLGLANIILSFVDDGTSFPSMMNLLMTTFGMSQKNANIVELAINLMNLKGIGKNIISGKLFNIILGLMESSATTDQIIETLKQLDISEEEAKNIIEEVEDDERRKIKKNI